MKPEKITIGTKLTMEEYIFFFFCVFCSLSQNLTALGMEAKNKVNTVTKVAEEKKETEVKNDIKVTSIRYTSGATVKKGDNYFKFIAEEEWDVSRIEDVQEAREKLWAKLNAEVDSQIEELNNMN